VGRIHDRNTSHKQMRDARWHPISPDAVWALVGDVWIADHGARNEKKPSAGIAGIPKHTHVREALPLQLNLGCCDTPLAGFINVDVVAGPVSMSSWTCATRGRGRTIASIISAHGM
jgi:hypothetical protein